MPESHEKQSLRGGILYLALGVVVIITPFIWRSFWRDMPWWFGLSDVIVGLYLVLQGIKAIDRAG